MSDLAHLRHSANAHENLEEDDDAKLRRIIARDYPPQNEIIEIVFIFDTGATCSMINEYFYDDN